MKILEKHLEEVIYEADSLDLCERGMCVSGKRFRQLRIGNYGVADLVTVEKSWNTYHYAAYSEVIPVLQITVYELKQYEISTKTLLQAMKYCKGIKRYLAHRKFKFRPRFRIVLVGKTVDLTDNLVYLPDLFDQREVDSFVFSMYTYKYELNGLKFTNIHDYQLRNEGF